MIKIKAGNVVNSRAIRKFSNADFDCLALKLIGYVLIRGSLSNRLNCSLIWILAHFAVPWINIRGRGPDNRPIRLTGMQGQLIVPKYECR